MLDDDLWWQRMTITCRKMFTGFSIEWCVTFVQNRTKTNEQQLTKFYINTWIFDYFWKCLQHAFRLKIHELCKSSTLSDANAKSSIFQWLMHRNVPGSCGCGMRLQSDPCSGDYPDGAHNLLNCSLALPRNPSRSLLILIPLMLILVFSKSHKSIWFLSGCILCPCSHLAHLQPGPLNVFLKSH